ncbi:MAG: ASCH domain-containing protein, partial [Dehalococcoidia bacterium]|nr:ASCH domain-containing protein [Dehalococcoidia bacterium]
MGAETLHLAILQPAPLAAILRGDKTIESRLSVDRRAPWQRVSAGDRLLLKRASGPVVASARAAWVSYHAGLTPDTASALLRAHPGLCADPAYVAVKRRARYATLIGLTDVRPLPPT